MAPTPHKEAAIYNFNYLRHGQRGILLCALIAGLFMRYSIVDLVRGSPSHYLACALLAADDRALDAGPRLSHALLGPDATLGLAFALTGPLSSDVPARCLAGSG